MTFRSDFSAKSMKLFEPHFVWHIVIQEKRIEIYEIYFRRNVIKALKLLVT